MLEIGREALHQMYVVEEQSIRACASKLYCQPSKVRKHLELNQIPIQKKKGGRVRVEERLKAELHMDDTQFKEYLLHLRFFQMLTYAQLAKRFKCSSASAQMVYKRYGIETKQRYNRLLTESRLYELYVLKNKTIIECADILDCSHTLVRYYLLKYKIPLRSAGAKRIEVHIKSRLGMSDLQLRQYLTELAKAYTMDELVHQLAHSKSSIRLMYKRLGIKKNWKKKKASKE
ncbi:hypothetical protein IC620_13780 [Hazenella sp. IB182357]|uniref:Uncharacterized protein n=1 Tax=Polycladospora coralii TaxID=2771432 RepID=A0A926NCR1_9BACL|nr:hypothetical protein [Polycladospora coralii]MBD1373420.1 hypothetical protein [Polycladospora coralii]